MEIKLNFSYDENDENLFRKFGIEQNAFTMDMLGILMRKKETFSGSLIDALVSEDIEDGDIMVLATMALRIIAGQLTDATVKAQK